ncbi:unnamed protein product [Protopolystoma xenopodis]|uniref:Uncharacterized protein n=1 Tax=Protopolystoma xenopodis TaxID=117903 RepID=A0A448WDJ8_9PLAT|nr:unnamed protein product [Protopolystoma xenopodis]
MPQSLTDAVRESLKNTLLVMFTGTHDTPPLLARPLSPDAAVPSENQPSESTSEDLAQLLWRITEQRLSTFLPDLMDQLFLPSLPLSPPVAFGFAPNGPASGLSSSPVNGQDMTLNGCEARGAQTTMSLPVCTSIEENQLDAATHLNNIPTFLNPNPIIPDALKANCISNEPTDLAYPSAYCPPCDCADAYLPTGDVLNLISEPDSNLSEVPEPISGTASIYTPASLPSSITLNVSYNQYQADNFPQPLHSTSVSQASRVSTVSRNEVVPATIDGATPFHPCLPGDPTIVQPISLCPPTPPITECPSEALTIILPDSRTTVSSPSHHVIHEL